MKVYSYTIACPDDGDVLPNCLNSLSKFVDRIYLVDTSNETSMIRQVRNGGILFKYIVSRPEYCELAYFDGDWRVDEWNGVELYTSKHDFTTPGEVRNWTLEHMGKDCDWIVALDADEIASNEMINGLRPFLATLPTQDTNVVQPLCNLVVDPDHMAQGHHSTWLSHARVHRPDMVKWTEQWHESMSFVGYRVQFPARIIHTRMLFRKRLLLQRGHDKIVEGAWADAYPVPVPADCTFDMEWLPDEPIGVPVDQTLGEYRASTGL